MKVLESVVEEMPKVMREGFQIEISLESRSSVFVNTSNPNVVILPRPKLSHSHCFQEVRISSQSAAGVFRALMKIAATV